VKRKKRASDSAVTAAPPSKSRLLEKSSTSPKNTSLSVSTSYDFADHVMHQPLVPHVSELDVSRDSLFIALLYIAVVHSNQHIILR